MSVDHPWVLALLVLALLPLINHGSTRVRYPWLPMIPSDPLSAGAGLIVRLAGVLAIAALVLGLAGLSRGGETVERMHEGAQIAIVLDRSRSMNDSFAGRPPEGGEETKAQAASRLLLELVERRPDNVYGLVEFSSSPIYALPLTTHTEAVRAGIRAASTNGLALTNIASPLGMAVGFFEGREYEGARVILLVSDGAAKIDSETRRVLGDWLTERDVRLYWVYMRSAGSPGIEPDADAILDDEVDPVPEQFLHEYFQGLGIPYRAYEADDPSALRQAVTDMDELERWPLLTSEAQPREPLSHGCYAAGLALILIVLATRLMEARTWT